VPRPTREPSCERGRRDREPIEQTVEYGEGVLHELEERARRLLAGNATAFAPPTARLLPLGER
jgi:hypothetical protein